MMDVCWSACAVKKQAVNVVNAVFNKVLNVGAFLEKRSVNLGRSSNSRPTASLRENGLSLGHACCHEADRLAEEASACLGRLGS